MVKVYLKQDMTASGKSWTFIGNNQQFIELSLPKNDRKFYFKVDDVDYIEQF